MLAGMARGAGLGAAAAMLYVAVDPNLRPAFWGALGQIAPRWILAFAVAGLWIGLVCRLLPGGKGGRLLAAIAGAALPLLGLALAVLAAPATPWTLVPSNVGAIFLASEMLFAALFAVGVLVGARPLARWGSAQVGGTSWIPWIAALLATLATVVFSRSGVWVPARDLPADPERRLVILGVDGADLRELSPLIDRGLTPNLGRLVREGASGPLTTFRMTLSPIIWTTIATGQTPHRHGIQGFFESETRVPYTSNSRRVPALWNLLGDRGVRVGVIGWWITWPAEPVNGTVVSYHATPNQGTRKGALHEHLPHQTHPPELMESLRPSIAPSFDAGRADVASFLDGYDVGPVDTLREKRRFLAAWAFGTDRVFSAAAVRVLQTDAPRFLATYFAAVDNTSHAFCASNPWRNQVCGRAIDAAYAAVDRQIGEILAAADPNAIVMVVSDHGFDRVKGHEALFPPGPDGVVILKGEGIAAGTRIEAASVYDIAPTVLALFDLPVPYDLRGRPLLSAFDPDFVAGWDIRIGPSVDPHLDSDDPSLRAIPSTSDAAFEERLRALGYID